MQKNLAGVQRAFGDAKRVIDAPASKRSALSDWDKMLSRARRSQAADFTKALPKNTQPKKGKGDGGLMSTIFGVAGGELIVDGLKAVAETALDAVLAVGKLAYSFIEAGLQGAAFAESSTKAIGYLTDNALHAGVVFDSVRHLAQGLGLDVEDTVHSFEKLLAAQFTVGQSKSLIKMSADMRAIGASAEETQRIIYALSEIKSIGTLQKRQERMLQMAGVSGQLIDQALMKRTGIKTKGGIDLARKKGLIDADTAIEAIKDAVMAKTHEQALGDVGANRANTQLTGMLDKLKGGIKNFWIDIGEAMEPGATRVAKLIAGTIGKITDDPKVAELGQFLLNKWEVFTTWVQSRWPKIESALVGGLHAVADVVESVINSVQKHEQIFELLGIALVGVALFAGILALALGAVVLGIGLLAAGATAVGVLLGGTLGYLSNQVAKWFGTGASLVSALVDGILSGLGPLGDALRLVKEAITFSGKPGSLEKGSDDAGVLKQMRAMNPALAAMGLFADPNAPTQIAPLIEGASAGGISGALSGLGGGKTEGGQKHGGAQVTIQNITVPSAATPEKQAQLIGAAVRSEMEKALHVG